VKRTSRYKTLRAYVDAQPRRRKQSEIARELGLSESQLSLYLTGARIPSRDVALQALPRIRVLARKPARPGDRRGLMNAEFNIADDATWPLVLTPEHIAAIYVRSVGAIKKACQVGRFIPAPYQRKPYRWRKADVLRHVRPADHRAAFRQAS
jgi:transcriptional regulator with XRE-family HTH domain